jgi:Domain of unknown function (DUF5011)
MKRVTIIFAITALVAMCLLGCVKKETPSRVVEIGYPTITLNGAPYVTLARGATWSDPGASWTDSITHETGTIKISVNTSVDSCYVLVYTATDKNGFSSFVTRGVGVTNNPDTANLSGNYTDQNSGNIDSVQKVAPALYLVPAIDGYDNGLFVLKTDGTISFATIIEQGLTAPGTNLPETFTQAYLNYAAPVTFGATATITNVPSFPIQFVHN